MESRKIQTYQNKAKNLYTIYFVLYLDVECKFISLQKGGSQEHICLITIFTVQVIHRPVHIIVIK